MSFKDQLSQDAVKSFLNTDEFAEEVIYTPSAGDPKVIKAVVVRESLEPSRENMARSLRNTARLYIANDEEAGVTGIDKKDDRITLNDIDGDERVARINEILHSDEGIWELSVGW